jgi:N-acetylneuraminic acid mutarotase
MTSNDENRSVPPRATSASSLSFTVCRLLVSTLIGAAGLGACRDEPTAPGPGMRPAAARAAMGRLEGKLHVLWGDPRPGSGRTRLSYQLVDDTGQATELLLDESLVARSGGRTKLDRKRVRVHGEQVAPGRVRVRGLVLESSGQMEISAAQLGSRPYVTIGCKFADDASEPQSIATYRAWTTGSTYPGLNHHWREQSFNRMDVAGSVAVGWYTLPQPRGYYVPNGAALGHLLEDCTAAADADVDFPAFYGINLQFNDWLDCCSWGGGWTLDLDGQTRDYGLTWMASWAGISVYAHEEGHSLGLPHSSGPYGNTYDSRWDVMSNAYPYWDGAVGSYIPQHTIGYHKSLLGWIAPARTYTAPPDSSRTITLERLALPGAGNYRLAFIPLLSSPYGQYTAEARRLVGDYDSHVPADAVVLHRVEGEARVVDVDNNGDPNDEASQWTVGETFTDADNGVTMTVNAMTNTGFRVTITRTSSNMWTARTPLPASRLSLTSGAVGGLVYAIGGKSGGSTLSSVTAYDPVSDAWSNRKALPGPRYDGSGSAVIAGVLYVPGGRNASGAVTRTLYAYDPSTNTWATRAALPAASGCGASAAIGERLYVLTGCDATGGFKGRLDRYTPSTNGWTARAASPAPHGFPAVGTIDGRLYVAGGKNSGGAATATLHVYDPRTNSWATKAPMPAPRFGAAGVVFEGRLYVVGGSTSQGTAATLYVYDPGTNQWGSKAPMPTARAKLGAQFIGGLLYAVGGQSGSQALATVERYTPDQTAAMIP